MTDRIMIVDDEPNFLRMLEFTLQSEGYEVVTAETGREGIEKIQAAQPHLAILDVSLPDISGIELCEHLRQDPKTVDIPVIMLSARSQTYDKIKGLRAGSDEYVTKPIDPEEIVARVEALLSRSRHLRQSSAASMKKGKIFAFMGSTGGVGATTVALNIAAALSQRSPDTAIIEYRPYTGTTALQLGMTPERTLGDLLALETDDITHQHLDRHLSTHASGMRVLCASQSPQEYRELLPDHTESILQGLAEIMDYSILDLPSIPLAVLPTVLQHCHVLSCVIEPEPISLACAKNLMQLLQAWGNTPIRVVLVNHGRSSSSLSLSEVKRQLNCEILGVMTPAAELCVKACNTQTPVVLSHPNSLAANALLEMTDRLVEEHVMALA
ncbi:MAG: hypothetical protein NPIRA02_09270 [Nitrospirales bacterium]|nr:MAG: hypothetical protein NPIRA02_09270 [Nitrospirales bacterium]